MSAYKITEATTYGDILAHRAEVAGTKLHIVVPQTFMAFKNDIERVDDIDVTIEDAKPLGKDYVNGKLVEVDTVTVHFRNAEGPEIHVEDIYKGDKWNVFMKSASPSTPFLSDLQHK